MRDLLPPPQRAAARAAVLASFPVLAAACGDDGVAPDARAPIPEPPVNAVAALRCNAVVAAATVSCEPLQQGGALASVSAGGPSRSVHIVGGQGTYVRLTSSSVTYAGGVFGFNVTVQNLSNQAMGTADGTTPHADGVRAFFASGPTATGGTGTVTVANATGTGTFTGAGQDYFQYNTELGGDGILSSGETSAVKNWQLNVPATVTTFSFVLYVATETPSATGLNSVAPQVTSISPATLVPGTSATLTGVNFNATPANNTVLIGGRTAAVTAATTTSLTVTVPCVSSGSVPVNVATGGMKGADFGHPLQVTQRTVGIGQMVVTSSAADSYCNELTSTGVASRYIVSVFSNSTTTTSNQPFQFSADAAGDESAPLQQKTPVFDRLAATPRLSLDQSLDAAQQQAADDKHAWLLEQNGKEYQRLRAHFGTRTSGPNLNRDVVRGDPPLTRTFRIPNINVSGFCNQFYVVSATRVYYNGKIAIYEDDATPNAFKASVSATMATNYQNIGDQFNNDMEPVVRTNFG
ncbi:MAG TPA: IPT/TIG domain-containing protein, partial [Longimicrobium sp.]|nr:IPT/TIG domain-containing protein [Longimicrobium sp.]